MSEDALSPAQKAFLARKRHVEAGGDPMEGVPMCKVCDGTGAVPCPQCDGTGRNAEDKFAEVRARMRVSTHAHKHTSTLTIAHALVRPLSLHGTALTRARRSTGATPLHTHTRRRAA